MKNWDLYRAALRVLPRRGRVTETDLPGRQAAALETLLRRHRCLGASLCLFDAGGVTGRLAFGEARPGVPAARDTVYRTASISKFVTALGILKMWEAGRVDLDRDVNDYLPFPLRHPAAPDLPLTLRDLMTHTAGLRDGKAYTAGIAEGVPLSQILRGDSFTDHPPRTRWEYSNLGAGIAGAALEGACGQDFETLMQETVFAPLGVCATYYPQKVQGTLADARRILPPHRGPNFDGAARQSRPLPDGRPDPEAHYALAHGSLCASAEALSRLGMAGMTPGFLRADTLTVMRKSYVPFGERAANLAQGLFTFVLRETKIAPRALYGHQGMAYGAVHGLFFDPERGQGVALLTAGADEARRGVLADLNFDLLSCILGGQ